VRLLQREPVESALIMARNLAAEIPNSKSVLSG